MNHTTTRLTTTNHNPPTCLAPGEKAPIPAPMHRASAQSPRGAARMTPRFRRMFPTNRASHHGS